MSEKRQRSEVAVPARGARREGFPLEVAHLRDLRAGVNSESQPGKYRAQDGDLGAVRGSANGRGAADLRNIHGPAKHRLYRARSSDVDQFRIVAVLFEKLQLLGDPER